MVVNWKTLKRAGVSRDTSVRMDLRRVRHATALQLILESAGKGLTFNVEDGLVVVSVRKPAKRNKE